MLSKGFEIEIYTGTPEADVVGLSDKIVSALDGFVREPDNRNVEYITAPSINYEQLLCALLRPRMQLRKYLHSLGNYTLIPGSTLSLVEDDRFFRSDPTNPYHSHIENAYGTKVVTASVHINIGIDDPETLMRACRVIRLEAPLFLALSASSPFIKGKASGFHSTRWGLFPQTPNPVPLFESHAHHINWIENQLANGSMYNVRHLWTSVRPNGDHRPYDLNRLELRICDLVTDPIALLAITAFLEARIIQIIDNPRIDPLTQSQLSPDELIDLNRKNEIAAATSSLDAQLKHWKDDSTITARDWITYLHQDLDIIAEKNGFSHFFSELLKILQSGNEAQQWLQLHGVGFSARDVLIQAIDTMKERERELELEDKVCSSLAA
ncbi:glutamate--cysteine ligase [Mastigocoleus sp. MO_188.B34]|uniref:glutamate--cysteine ligase n=1 Tax=Mastigocoleus sp. MO_188.B34 TaxID=3036635 RepID=UPI00260C5DBB|nr:glutamate--cysteine ligase [Mastigocoleus sp. MO_188.B34]MDJ0694941.1 glutamate--cysteine ligase [Mastigocoleus sp. MO_188.B34]